MINAKSRQLYDAEKISVNTAWVKRHGQHFEVVVDPDLALAYRKSKGAGELRECLHAERIFSDAKRGLHAKESDLQEVFGTQDALEVAKVLLLEGELQLTAEHRAKLRERRHNEVLNRLVTYAIDPKSGLPHPQKRIELAMEEAKVRIDDNRDVEDQIPQIVRKLQPIIPIRLETVTLSVHLPVPYGQKLYGDVQRSGTLKKTEWLPDGALLASLEIPAGLQVEFIEELGKKTHGVAEIRKVNERNILQD